MGIQITGSNDTIQAADGNLSIEGVSLNFNHENVTGISTMATAHVTGTTTIDNDLKVGVSTFFVDKSEGKIGIGTDSPGFTVEVLSATGTTIRVEDINNAVFTDLRSNSTGALLRTASNHPVVFGVNQAEKARIDTGGRLLVGTETSDSIWGLQSRLQVEGTSGDTASVSISRNSNDGGGAILNFAKSRGTSDGSNTIVNSGDVVGQIAFIAADGTDKEHTSASIAVEVDGTPGANDLPGRILFKTTLDGASSSTERMRIKNDGRILISSDISTVNVPLVEIYNTAAQSQEGACLKLRSGRGGGVKDTAILGIHDNADREFFRVQNDGVVGVNTTTFNTGSKLEVSSEGAYGIISRSQNGNGGYHVFTGQSSGGTNTSYISHNGRGYFEDGVQFDSTGESLDSYEEGTWTPVPENTTNTPTYHNQAGIYTKIGNLVTVVGFIQFNVAPTFSSNDSELRVTGLPFTANGSGYMNTVGNVTFQSLNWSGSTYNDYGAEGNLVCGVVENTKNVFKVNPAGNNLIRGTLRREAFEGGGIITWSMTYKTNS